MVLRMNARLIRAEVFKDSVQVFEKNGIILEKTVDRVKCDQQRENYHDFHVLWWQCRNCIANVI